MIQVLMTFGTEHVLISIRGSSVFFASTAYGAKEATIDGLKLSYSGVIKEFPELKDEPNWRQEAIAKFKDKMNSMKDEADIAQFVIKDLRKFGYTPKYIQKNGFRRERIN